MDKVLEAIVDDYSEYTTFDVVKSVFESTYEDKTVISAKAMYYSLVGDFYEDDAASQVEIYRYIFKTKKTEALGNLQQYVLSRYTLNMIFIDSRGIYAWNEAEKEPVKISSYKDAEAVKLLGVSDNGKLAAWAEGINEATEVYVSEEGEKTKVGNFDDIDGEYQISQVELVNNGTEAIFYHTGSEKIFRKKQGKEPQEIHAGGNVELAGIYSAKDKISINEKAKVEELYVEVESNNEDGKIDLYCIEENGERQKLLSDITLIWYIKNGKVFYEKDEETLYCADLGKMEVKNETKLASDVMSTECSFDGRVLYFQKLNDVEELTSLYVVRTDGKILEPEKIASGVSGYNISEDGMGVAYTAQGRAIEDASGSYGELYVKYMGKDAKKISSDVAWVYSNKEYSIIDVSELAFFKYDTLNDDNKIIGNYEIYDGKNVSIIGKELIFSR
ncbi:MAG: hypothetical protein QM793_01980 [Muricomes sp.]